jgi:hypothetical protein
MTPNCKNAVKLPLKHCAPIADGRQACENLGMPTIETRLRQELRDCAVELRQLAYTMPHGVGEHDLLQLSDRMHAAAGHVVRKGA